MDAFEQLAEALAATWNGSQANATACAAMQRLLPGLQYMSIALACPGLPNCLVAADNCAAPGPLELHLHDADRSAAGQALARGKPLQASLPNGPAAAAAAAAWSDVAQMLGAGVPGITHLQCLPFGSSSDGRGSGSAAAGHDRSCPQGRQLGSGAGSAGALLCGFVAAPNLDRQHKAALTALLRHLPATAGLAGGTLDFVAYVCASLSACCCESSQAAEPGAPSEGCNSDSANPSGGAGSSSGGTQLQLPVPVAGSDPAENGSSPEAEAGAGALPVPRPALGSSGSGAPAGAAAREEASGPTAAPASPAASPVGRHGFCKQLLAHVAAEPEALHRRSVLCLRFCSDQVEQQYEAWLAPAQLWTDTLGSVLIIAAMLIVALRKPFQLWHNAPATLALGAGMLAPLAFTTLGGPRYAVLRDAFIVFFRLYAVVFACTAGIPAISVPLPPEQVHHWGPFWRLSGAESLLATSLGFLLRQRLHVPSQAAALAIALASLPGMCSQSFPDGCQATCVSRGAITAATLGAALPAVLLRIVEQRSRATFARLLRTAAAGC